MKKFLIFLLIFFGFGFSVFAENIESEIIVDNSVLLNEISDNIFLILQLYFNTIFFLLGCIFIYFLSKGFIIVLSDRK